MAYVTFNLNVLYRRTAMYVETPGHIKMPGKNHSTETHHIVYSNVINFHCTRLLNHSLLKFVVVILHPFTHYVNRLFYFFFKNDIPSDIIGKRKEVSL